MARKDRKYKHIHLEPRMRQAWVQLACARLAWGVPRLESIRPLPTVQSLQVWGGLQERILDAGWRFDTDRRQGSILVAEIQADTDYMMSLRILCYASALLVNLHRTERYGPTRPPPRLAAILVYTGDRPWTPPSLETLTGQAEGTLGTPFPCLYMDLQHHDFTAWELPSEIELLVTAERIHTPHDIQASGFLQRAAQLADPAMANALAQFLAATIADWQDLTETDRRLLDQVEYDWDAIKTLGELEMATHTIARGYAAVLQQGREEGRQQGMEAGIRLGMEAGRQQSTAAVRIDMLCAVIEPATDRAFGAELRGRLQDPACLARLDIGTAVDLRFNRGLDADGIKQALRELLAGPAATGPS